MGTEEKEAVAGEARMKASYQAEVTDLWGARPGAADQRHRQRACKAWRSSWRAAPFYSTGALDLTQWIAYYGFAIQLTNILSNYCSSWSNFKGAQGSVDRVSQIMDERGGAAGRGAGLRERSRGNISLRDVCFSYGDTALFTGLDAEIPAGKITAIVGPFRQRQDNAAEPDRPAVPAGKGDHRRGRAGHRRYFPAQFPPGRWAM